MVIRRVGYLSRPTPPSNPLGGMPLLYLIGAKTVPPVDTDTITEVPYGEGPPVGGKGIGYCNHFDEEASGKFFPYLRQTDTAKQYNELRPDPKGAGFLRNLTAQFELRQVQGFEYIEIDNPDAYPIENVLGVIDLAAMYGLRVVAKNPLLMGSSVDNGTDPRVISYLVHPNVYGAIVERDCGSPSAMNIARLHANKPFLPVWFVSWGDDRSWIKRTAMSCRYFSEMRCSHSPGDDEYSSSVPIVAGA